MSHRRITTQNSVSEISSSRPKTQNRDVSVVVTGMIEILVPRFALVIIIIECSNNTSNLFNYKV